MDQSNERLRHAREEAGFKSARSAAIRFGWTPSTYASHENGQTPVPPSKAMEYARAFRTSAAWILTGESKRPIIKPRKAPLVGYVGAGAEAHLYSEAQGPFETVTAPEGSTDETVAVEVRGDSLGPFFDQWLAFYDAVQRPATPNLINKLCVVGLEDGRVLIKKLQRSRTPGLYHLLSQTEAPILDVPVAWAAQVRSMVPRNQT